MLPQRKISHRNLEKTFIEAIKKIRPSVRIDSEPKLDLLYRPDIVLEENGKRILVELKSSMYPTDVARSIYHVVGYFNLATESFDHMYIVLPAETLSSPELRRLTETIQNKLPRKIGIITYFTTQSTITYEVVTPTLEVLPRKFSMELPPTRIYKRTKVSLSSPKAMRVVRYMLLKDETSQSEISRMTKVSVGHVNKVVRYLRDQEIVSYKGRKMVVVEPWKLLNEVSWSRAMNGLKIGEPVAPAQCGDVESTEAFLRDICKNSKAKYSFTLFSAARRYIPYFKKYDAVQLYIDDYESVRPFLSKKLVEEKGRKGITIEVFQPDSEDLLKESVKTGGFSVCSEIQTVIDLVCYGTIGRELAIELYSKIRGREF